MIRILSFFFVFLLGIQTYAESLYDVKVNGQRIYDLFIKEGVPATAIQRTFEFLDVNARKTINVKIKIREKSQTVLGSRNVTIKDDLIAIIDFSKPSTERRLYILNLKTGVVSKHFVAHGKGSGVNIAAKFSNIDGSKMSSLGLYVAANTYYGKHKQSLNLSGLEDSNNNAAERDIVIHSANYVSENFIKAHGRLGRSWGCPAVSPNIIQKIIASLKEGGVVYAYHKDLIASAKQNPILQEVPVQGDEADIDLPDEEETLNSQVGP